MSPGEHCGDGCDSHALCFDEPTVSCALGRAQGTYTVAYVALEAVMFALRSQGTAVLSSTLTPLSPPQRALRWCPDVKLLGPMLKSCSACQVKKVEQKCRRCVFDSPEERFLSVQHDFAAAAH